MSAHREDVTELPGLELPVLGPTGRPVTEFSQMRITGPNTCSGMERPLNTVWHDASALPAVSATSPRNGDFQFLGGDLVIAQSGVEVCMPSAHKCTTRVPVEGVDSAGILSDMASYVLPGPYIGRIDPNGVTEIISVREPPTS